MHPLILIFSLFFKYNLLFGGTDKNRITIILFKYCDLYFIHLFCGPTAVYATEPTALPLNRP